MACDLSVVLGGITFDCETTDGDGFRWTFDALEGWWNSTTVESSAIRALYGDTITAVHEKSRAMVLSGGVFLPTGEPLGDLLFAAERKLKAAMRFAYVPGLMVVNEPGGFSLQAYVRRIEQEIRMKQLGELLFLQFEVPLTAPDPRRYDTTLTIDTALTLTTTGTLVNAAVTNNGDETTFPIITIDQPATNPKVTNVDTGQFVQWIGTLGGTDVLVVDLQAGTVTLNGVNAIQGVAPGSQFWHLAPGINNLRYERTAGSGTTTAQLDYRDAYS